MPRVDDCKVVSGIIHVIRNGLRWRDAPEIYGPHKTLYNRFIRWSKIGMFDQIFTALADLPSATEMLGDKGYDSDAYRAALVRRGITPCIPLRAKRKNPATCCKALYKQRQKVKNMFAKLKDWRRIAMRYERCAHVFLSAIQIAAVVIFWFNQ